jgi:hypothetical protein
MPYLFGFAGLGAFWLILLIATGQHPWSLTIGEDGRPSTSKFQMLVWLGTVVFAYLAIYEVRFSHGHPEGLPEIPQNLLIAMGISVATTIAAKAIAVNSSNKAAASTGAGAGTTPALVAAGTSVVAAVAGPGEVAAVVVTPAAAPPVAPVVAAAGSVDQSDIFRDFTGSADLGKVQVVLWTFIAVGIFLCGVVTAINHPAPCVASGACGQGMPDIGQTLMILMGLGHGAYIGNKIAGG